MAELRGENDGLLRLVVRLSDIIRQNVAEQRELLDIHGGEVDPRVLVAMTPAEFVPRLREVSLRCAQLGRDCSDRPTAQGLEELGVQLAVEAEKLEAVLAARHAGMS